MKIFGRTFVFPIRISVKNEFSMHGIENSLIVRYYKTGSGGTMKTTSYYMQIETKTKKYEFSFCWRPDVTRYWWNEK